MNNVLVSVNGDTSEEALARGRLHRPMFGGGGGDNRFTFGGPADSGGASGNGSGDVMMAEADVVIAMG